MAVSPEALHLEIESWTLYGITLLFILARMWVACPHHDILSNGHIRSSRRLLLGSWRRLQIDDYLMLFTLVSLWSFELQLSICVLWISFALHQHKEHMSEAT